jgi:hypothetical protein
MQYVKMYTIFMMQLQVNNEFQMHWLLFFCANNYFLPFPY